MKPGKFTIIGVIILEGIIISFLSLFVILPVSKDRLKVWNEIKQLSSHSAIFRLEIPRDDYLLKIKHIIQEDQEKKIKINNYFICPEGVKKRGIIETNWFYIPKKLISDNTNEVSVNFLRNFPPEVEITLSNYRKTMGEDIFIFFRNSSLATSNFSLISWVKLFIFSEVNIILLCFVLALFYNLTILKLSYLQLSSLMPLFIFLVAINLCNIFLSHYKIFFLLKYLWHFGLIGFLFVQISLLFKKKVHRSIEPSSIFKTINFLKIKDISDKFIVLFIITWSICALLMILHLKEPAQLLSLIAYFSLFLGTIMKYIKVFFKNER